jgi:hypothetical protein
LTQLCGTIWTEGGFRIALAPMGARMIELAEQAPGSG